MLNPGQQTSILLGSATAHCAVGVTMVHAVVDDVREKAVCLRAVKEDGNLGSRCWFPRKALRENKSGSLALWHWFKPGPDAREWLARYAQSSVIAA